MSATDAVAWYGAIVATIVFAWDVYKHFSSGARILLDATPNMKMFGDVEVDEDAILVLFKATNAGDKPTTLENLTFVWYSSLWRAFRGKADKSFFVKHPGRHQRFPFPLDVGATWNGMAYQNDELEQLVKSGFLYANLYYAASRKPATVRLRTKRKEAK